MLAQTGKNRKQRIFQPSSQCNKVDGVYHVCWADFPFDTLYILTDVVRLWRFLEKELKVYFSLFSSSFPTP